MTKLRILAVAYVLLAALVTPALLWAADPPPSADVTDTTTGSEAPWISSQAPKTPADAGSTSKAGQTATTPAPRHPADAAQPAPSAKPIARAAGAKGVTIRDFEFAPKSITVKVGDTVTWTNDGPTGHSATAEDKSFDTGILAKGKTGSHTFTKAGTYAYICTPHQFMRATIVVAAAAGNDTGSNTGDDTSGSDTAGGGSSPAGGGGSTPASASGSSGAGTGSSSLPNTGWDVGLVALFGFGLLLIGLGLRERGAAAAQR